MYIPLNDYVLFLFFYALSFCSPGQYIHSNLQKYEKISSSMDFLISEEWQHQSICVW